MSEFRRRMLMAQRKASGMASYTINQTTQTKSVDMISVSSECTAIINAIHNASHLYIGELINDVLVCKQVSDTDKTLYADGTSIVYDSNKDMFMRLPQFWYKSEPDASNDDICNISFSINNPNNPSWIEWEGNSFIGAYNGALVDGKLRSISGVTTGDYKSLTNWRNLARARGNGFSCITYDMRKIYVLLSFGRLQSINPRAAGYNFGSSSKVSGECDSLGMNDGKLNNHSNFWGLEDFITSVGLKIFIDNLQRTSNGYNILDTQDLSNIIRTIQCNSYFSGNNWCSKIVLGNYGDILPKDTVTTRPSDTTSYGGYVMITNQNFMINNDVNTTNTSLVNLLATSGVDTSTVSTTTRLCYKGNYQIIN